MHVDALQTVDGPDLATPKDIAMYANIPGVTTSRIKYHLSYLSSLRVPDANCEES